MKCPIPKDKVLTLKQIKLTICRFFMKNSNFPATIRINPKLLSDLLDIFSIREGKLKDLQWTVYNMEIIIDSKQQWFELQY